MTADENNVQLSSIVAAHSPAYLFQLPGRLRIAAAGQRYYVAQGPRRGETITVAWQSGERVCDTDGAEVKLSDLGSAPLPPPGRKVLGPLPEFRKIPIATIKERSGTKMPGSWREGGV